LDQTPLPSATFLAKKYAQILINSLIFNSPKSSKLSTESKKPNQSHSRMRGGKSPAGSMVPIPLLCVLGFLIFGAFVVCQEGKVRFKAFEYFLKLIMNKIKSSNRINWITLARPLAF
jgi:hypothetical protein